MKKQVYDIYENGYIKEIYVSEVDENGTILDEDKIHFISVTLPHGLLKPKWNGTQWIEGESEEERLERESLILIESLKPTQQEIQDAELEIKVITLLTDLEVI